MSNQEPQTQRTPSYAPLAVPEPTIRVVASLKRRGIDYVLANAGTDFAPVIEGLVRGILDATDELAKNEQSKQGVGKMMDEFYSLPPGTGGSMLADAHWTNYAEGKTKVGVKPDPAEWRIARTLFVADDE